MIRFEDVTKVYKTTKVVDKLSFEVNKGEIVVLIGPSGCGKTTTLKMINRLIEPTAGKIYIDGQDISKHDHIKLRRNMGYVIQQVGLFPHLTVRENIEIIPKLERRDPDEVDKRTKFLLKLVGMGPEYLDRYPTQLSGGQSQRIGVARAFATDPEVILMDEPFSALDPITRNQLQDELVNLQSRLKKTIVFITHDMNEAIKIADRIGIIKDGQLVQYDTPENILKNPIDDFVSDFVGKNRIWSNPAFIRARDIMVTTPVTVFPGVPVLKAIENMRLRRIDRLLVVDEENKFLGIVHAVSLSQCEDKSKPVSDLIREPRATTHPEESILDLLEKFKRSGATNMPVVGENGKLEGLVTTSNLVTTLSQQFIDFGEVAGGE